MATSQRMGDRRERGLERQRATVRSEGEAMCERERRGRLVRSKAPRSVLARQAHREGQSDRAKAREGFAIGRGGPRSVGLGGRRRQGSVGHRSVSRARVCAQGAGARAALARVLFELGPTRRSTKSPTRSPMRRRGDRSSSSSWRQIAHSRAGRATRSSAWRRSRLVGRPPETRARAGSFGARTGRAPTFECRVRGCPPATSGLGPSEILPGL